jgi:hypothetical protein
MFLKPPKVLPLSIVMLLTIMCSLNYILMSFFIKDRELRKVLLQGRSRGGHYPLPCSSSISTHVRQVHHTVETPTSRWHAHLGRPSLSIVRFVLSKNNILIISDASPESVCDACQQVKGLF